MAKPKNPRMPKKNSRLTYIDQLMRFSWGAYRRAKEYELKRDSIISLRNDIDKWLAEPGVVYDLAKGASEQVHRECWASISPPDAAFPFDASGKAGDIYFFMGGYLSELFTAEQLELDDVRACIHWRDPYYVFRLEKVYATENSTTMHFFSYSAFGQHAGAASGSKHPEQGQYLVLADPTGHREGHAMIACLSKSSTHARKRAIELAEKFDIRFLVTRVDEVINVH